MNERCKMKVLIVGFSQIRYMPYLYFHLDKYKNDEIDLVTWNRDGSADVPFDEQQISFHYKFESRINRDKKHTKLIKFYQFRRFVKKILDKNAYDRIVLLHTFPAVLLADVFIKNYKDRYVFDYKDITYEKYTFFKEIVSKLVKNSKYTLVSSKGFLKYLPESNKIYISHNIMQSDLQQKYSAKTISENKVISFWGMIRDYAVNESLLKQMKENESCTLQYYGTINETAMQLIEFVKQDKINNVEFKGTYNNGERAEFIKNVDFIHNLYSTTDYNMNLAMSNKFYDGIIFHVPQICAKGSLMGELVEKYGIGFSIDIDKESLKSRMEEFCATIDYDEFDRQCELCLGVVLDEYEKIKNLD